MSRRKPGMVSFVLSMLVTAASSAAIIYVDYESTASSPDGSTWPLAFPDLQSGLDAVSSGDVLWVADGEYVATDLTDIGDLRSATF